MRRYVLLIATVSSLALLACGSSKPSTSDEAAPAVATTGTGATAKPAEATAPEAAAPAAGESKVGTVKYEEIPPTKSVRAYTGEELFLVMDGERITLRPTEAVNRDRLLGLDGRRVRLKVEWTEGHPPAEGVSAPLDMGGKPLPQGAGWRVLAVEAEL